MQAVKMHVDANNVSNAHWCLIVIHFYVVESVIWTSARKKFDLSIDFFCRIVNNVVSPSILIRQTVTEIK